MALLPQASGRPCADGRYGGAVLGNDGERMKSEIKASGSSGLADVSTHFPQTVLVDLSSACNATCTMCPTQLNPLRKKLIDPALFQSIVDQVAQFPASPAMFYIGVHGEPLLDKRLADKVALCNSRGIKTVTVSTNGSLLTPERARELLQASPYIIIVSLESMDAALFESIRIGLRHDVVVENIKSLFTLRNALDSQTRIALRFIVSSRNAHEQQAFKQYWSSHLRLKKGDYFADQRIHNWGYGDPGKFYGSSPCPHVSATTILSDGSVVFCCLDHEGVYLLGNLKDRPLLDIFNDAEAQRLRAIHLAGQRHTLKMCSTCDVAEEWSGRPIDALYDDFAASNWVQMPAGA